jgi:transcriptional regulator with XRE-family HTH domain
VEQKEKISQDWRSLIRELDEVRKSQKINQAALGKMIGKSQTEVARFFAAKHNPGIEIFFEIGYALGVVIELRNPYLENNVGSKIISRDRKPLDPNVIIPELKVTDRDAINLQRDPEKFVGSLDHLKPELDRVAKDYIPAAAKTEGAKYDRVGPNTYKWRDGNVWKSKVYIGQSKWRSAYFSSLEAAQQSFI